MVFDSEANTSGKTFHIRAKKERGMNVNKSKTTEEVEDALRELVLLRTRHHGDDPALQLVDELLAEPEPPDDAEWRRQLKMLFGQLRRDLLPLVLTAFVVGQERA